MAVDRAYRIMRQIAGAVGAAHALGIVHRDLKPENIMLVDRAETPDFVKVLDFGIAKVNFGDEGPGRRALTRVGAVFGTPEYMSPEQALGEPVDGRSDLYALGVILYEMLEGGTPFASDEPTRVLAAHITAPPPALGAHVPAPLASVVNRLLAKKPAQRVQSAKELVQLLDEAALMLSQSMPAIAMAAVVAAPPASSPHLGYAATQMPPSEVSVLSIPQSPTVAALPAPAAARAAWESLLADLAPLLSRKVKVGTAEVPVWSGVVAAGTALFMLVLIVVVVGRACGSSSPDKAVAVDFQSLAPTSAATAQPLPAGDGLRKEVERIESTPVYERKQKDWVALGHGYAAMGKCKDAALAYRGALSIGRQPASEPQVLADLFECGKDSEAWPIIINQCEAVTRRGGLGTAGLDLLWDLWIALSQDPAKESLAEQTFKKLVISSRRGSSELRSAIELHNATSCKSMKSALEYAAKHADSRSLARLQQVERTRDGCGADKSEDCFECIRGSSEFDEALKRAQNHAAPTLANAYKE